MRRIRLSTQVLSTSVASAALLAAWPIAMPARASDAACKDGAGGLTLPAGFCATVFADNIGHARHLVVAPDGTVYVNTWSGRYYKNDTPPGGRLPRRAEGHQRRRQGRRRRALRRDARPTGGHGGTGIALYKGGSTPRSTTASCAIALATGEVAPKAGGRGRRLGPAARPATIRCTLRRSTPKGELFVDLGSATNACQVEEPHAAARRATSPAPRRRPAAAPGATTPTRPDQTFSPAERYATGIRNGEGFAFDAAGRLFVDPARPRPADPELAEALHAPSRAPNCRPRSWSS